MQTKTRPMPAVKNYRLFDGDAWAPAVQSPEPQPKLQPRRPAPPLRCASGCCAYTDEGNICGVTPAPFLDLQRGGMVCATHHRETEGL